MHPVFSNRRRLLVHTLIWLAIGLNVAGLLQLANMASWRQALIFALPSTFVFGFVSTSAYFVSRSLPLGRRELSTACMQFGGASVTAGFIWLGLSIGWNNLLAEGGIQLSPAIHAVLVASGSALYLLSILGYDLWSAMRDVHAAKQRELESSMLAREAELQALRAQINPHFLFNSLNSISALTAFDSNAAREMTIELAAFFRQTLTLAEQRKVMLAQEIALSRHFLAVEKVRFGERLSIDWQLDPAADPGLVPPMLLQPLLENALKHGLHDLEEGGCIRVMTHRNENWLTLRVENPMPTTPTRTKGNGVGLANLRRRCETLYGENAGVKWRVEEGWFCVECVLPFEG